MAFEVLRPRRLAPAFGVLMIVVLGCNPPAPPKPAVETTPDAAAQKTEAKPSVDRDACVHYANKFCDTAGQESANCKSMRSLAELMPPEACAAGMENLEFTKTRIGELTRKCDELVTKLCTDLGPDSQTCGMVKEVTPKFPPERCQEMLAQYPAVLAELKTEEERNKPLTADTQATIAASDAPSFGPADAKVTIVEFSDFQCPYCTRAAAVTTQIKEKYGDKVRFVFRQFPLSFHGDAHLAAEAGLAAADQGKFWEFHDLVFSNQKEIKREHLEKYAQQLKLDMGKFKKALDAGAYKQRVDDDMAMGTAIAVDGTPTMFLNGARVANPTSFEVIAAMIDQELGGGAPSMPGAPGTPGAP